MAGLRVVAKSLPPAVRATWGALTPLQQRFVVAYCGSARGNATLAAWQAGIKTSYGLRAARASQMLRQPGVRAAIQAWMTAFALTGVELTAQFADLTQANPGPFLAVAADGSLKVRVLSKKVWETYKHWIRDLEIDPETGKVTKIHLHDALAARRDLAKILKLYSDAPQLTLHLHLQQLSDGELLQQLEEARGAVRRTAMLGVN